MTANQGVELGLEQRTVCTVKGWADISLYDLLRSPPHTWQQPPEAVPERLKLGKHCLWPKINNCLKAHLSFIG